jgi:hypothetical protein
MSQDAGFRLVRLFGQLFWCAACRFYPAYFEYNKALRISGNTYRNSSRLDVVKRVGHVCLAALVILNTELI